MTFDLIYKIEMTTSTASASFTKIPDSFDSLFIVANVRSERANQDNDNLRTIFNPNSGGTYDYKRIYGYGNQTEGSDTVSRSNIIPTIPATTSTSDMHGTTKISLPRYSQNVPQVFHIESYVSDTDQTGIIEMLGGIWDQSEKINEITFTPNNADFAANSTIYLYGIKNESSGTVTTS